MTTKKKVFRPRGVESNGLRYYQERNGDYLCVDPASAGRYQVWGSVEGRAAAISNMANSVCTTGISLEFLRTKCRRVWREDVPEEWLEVLG